MYNRAEKRIFEVNKVVIAPNREYTLEIIHTSRLGESGKVVMNWNSLDNESDSDFDLALNTTHHLIDDKNWLQLLNQLQTLHQLWIRNQL